MTRQTRAEVKPSRDQSIAPLQTPIVPFYETHESGAKPKGFFRLLINEHQADAAARAMWIPNVLVTLFALGVAIVLVFIASRVLVRPILSLVDTSQRIAQGDLTHRTE